MLTGQQAADILNLVEERVVAALGEDAWLKEGGTGGIKKIRTKALPTERLQVWESSLPCLVVAAEGLHSRHGEATFGAYEQRVGCEITYLASSGDLAEGIDGAQTATARLMRWLHLEGGTSGTRLDGLLDDGDGCNSTSSARVGYDDGDRFFMRAVLSFELSLRVRAQE